MKNKLIIVALIILYFFIVKASNKKRYAYAIEDIWEGDGILFNPNELLGEVDDNKSTTIFFVIKNNEYNSLHREFQVNKSLVTIKDNPNA